MKTIILNNTKEAREFIDKANVLKFNFHNNDKNCLKFCHEDNFPVRMAIKSDNRIHFWDTNAEWQKGYVDYSFGYLEEFFSDSDLVVNPCRYHSGQVLTVGVLKEFLNNCDLPNGMEIAVRQKYTAPDDVVSFVINKENVFCSDKNVLSIYY